MLIFSVPFEGNLAVSKGTAKPTASGPGAIRFCLAAAAVVVFVSAGALLRLFWAADMEYKGDERWTFERTQRVGRTEPLPWLGMQTSCEALHPGGTVWTFVALAKVLRVEHPVQLARACQLLNIVAILLLVAFAITAVASEEREAWLWAVALGAVNPVAVLNQRKIWPPSVIPVFTALFVIFWWHRERRWGAFGWGLIGALLGFLYPAAMFLAAGFALWAALFDRRRVAWRWWLPGSILGALPLLPWFQYVFTQYGVERISQRHWSHFFHGKLFARWLAEPFGFGLHDALGKDTRDFLRYPLLNGQPTYLVAILCMLLLVAGAVLLGATACALWRRRQRWADLAIGRQSATAFTHNACLLGFGLVFALTLLPSHRHYLIITFPMMFLWVAHVALLHRRTLVGPLTWGRSYLGIVWLAQFLVSASFLHYVHVNPRAIRGDYGVPYAAQAEAVHSARSNLPVD